MSTKKMESSITIVGKNSHNMNLYEIIVNSEDFEFTFKNTGYEPDNPHIYKILRKTTNTDSTKADVQLNDFEFEILLQAIQSANKELEYMKELELELASHEK